MRCGSGTAHEINTLHTCLLDGMTVLTVTCDKRIEDSAAGLSLLYSHHLGQVIDTYEPLPASSVIGIIWWWAKNSDVLWLGR